MQWDLMPATWQRWCWAVLALAMAMALEADVRARRIPNTLVLALLGAGVLLNAVGPANGGGGALDAFPGALGAGGALLGALAGLLLFLPLYLLRAMGAGDVKLMAALGSVVGAADAPGLALCVLLAGGVLALLRMLWLRKTALVLRNIGALLASRGGAFATPAGSADRMPFALAFAGGLLLYGGWRFAGGPGLFRS